MLLDAQSQVAYDRARDVLDASSEARRTGYVRSVRALGVLLGSAEPRAHWLVVGASDQDDGSVPVAWLDEFGTRQPLDLADGYAEAVTDLCATLPWKWTGVQRRLRQARAELQVGEAEHRVLHGEGQQYLHHLSEYGLRTGC
ncbi:hypothetical protein [Janibacter terrae]|uniref:hypothetical protein n=1 Tax=Janibacter terrae TaxID=103817 RepID=UPI000829FAF3|nr:hypothetical protein [Janibacter terrae]